MLLVKSKILFFTSCLMLLTGGAFAVEPCTSVVKDIYGVMLYRKCHCSTFSYPEVTAAMIPLGIKTTPQWVACSDYDQDGTEWCVCGVSLSWEKKPENPEKCLETRAKVKQILDSGRFDDVAFSYPLICPFE
ncbi:MAG: hypothetical protein AB4426_01160 [Xenococcaceae cyanobacterium]